MKTLFSKPWTTRALILALALPLPAVSSPSEGPRDSAEAAEFLQGDLSHDRDLSGSQLQAEVREGVAIVTGTVNRLSQRQRALRIAAAIKGVRAVIDETIVQPASSPGDDSLMTSAQALLASSRAIRAGAVTVTAKDGLVTLQGAVDSPEERTIAVDLIGDLPGVLEIRQQLVVLPNASIPDERLAATAEHLLKTDVRLQGLRFQVQVSDHALQLAGSLPSADERARIRDLVAVTGVRDVDTRGVRIDANLAMEEFESKKTDDASIEGALKTSFRLSNRVPANIHAEASGGFVMLTGTAGDAGEKEEIARLASNVAGVHQVLNGIAIADARDDETVAQNVDAALVLAPGLRHLELHASCDGGTCTLKGVAFTDEQRRTATSLAARQPGVRTVIDELTTVGSFEAKAPSAARPIAANR